MYSIANHLDTSVFVHSAAVFLADVTADAERRTAIATIVWVGRRFKLDQRRLKEVAFFIKLIEGLAVWRRFSWLSISNGKYFGANGFNFSGKKRTITAMKYMGTRYLRVSPRSNTYIYFQFEVFARLATHTQIHTHHTQTSHTNITHIHNYKISLIIKK